MYPLIRRVLVAGFACVLLATAAPLPAQAEPQATAAVPRPRFRDRRDLPRNEISAIVWGRRMAVASVNARTRTMDYRKADRADGGHRTTRRRFAAGFWTGGGRILHIRAELALVRRHIPRGVYVQPWNPLRTNVLATGAPASARSRGPSTTS